ncbi:MAG: hypothetical protein PHG06_00635 [Parabacteroides sp.]|nr:hypothetical protein [Parabacteroides sp.]
MEPLTIEQLRKVMRYANDLGFNDYVRNDGEYAYFEIGIPSARITVYYEVTLVKGANAVHGEVSVGWSSCDGGQVSVAQTNDFIKFMGYAVQIAEKLKE